MPPDQAILDRDWEEKRAAAKQSLPDALVTAEGLPAVLLPYQAGLLSTTALHNFVVSQKSRRIGMTWGIGADAVLTSGAAKNAGGMDTLYIGYNLDMAREFIDVCAMWARAFMDAGARVKEFLFKYQDDDGQEKDILAFRINFASGFEIVALTSKPRSLRGRQGFLIFDEAAFHDDLDEMLKAGMAFLIWGGKVLVISTHDGQDNAFNQLIIDIQSGKRPGHVHTTTFDDAIADGLYERIALVTGLEDTPEAKAKWIEEIVSFYGEAGDEELRCIPRAGSGAYMSGAQVEACMSPDHEVVRLTCPDGFNLRPMEERRKFVDDWLRENVQHVLSRFDDDLASSLGVDFARTTDLSVFVLGQEHRDMSLVIPLIIELKNVPIAQQEQIIEYLLSGVAIFRAGKFDATGNGLGLAEWAQEKYGHERIEAIMLSTRWYLENMPPLKQHFEDQTISLVLDQLIRDDVRGLKLVRGVPTVPDNRKAGRHCDAAVALAMFRAASKTDIEIIEVLSDPSFQSRYSKIEDPKDFLFGDADDDQGNMGRFGKGTW